MLQNSFRNSLKLLSLSLLTVILSCNSDSGGSFDQNKIYYTYGSDALPGSLPALTSSYRPVHLSQKVFLSGGETYSPMNFLTENLTLTMDVQTSQATGEAIIDFNLSTDARPVFQFIGTVLSATLDGASVSAFNIQDPDGENQTYWAINQVAQANSQHQLILRFQIRPDNITFTNGGVRVLTDMTDLYPANFLEYWSPTGFEDDAYQMNLDLKVLNSTSTHRLFTNGDVTSSTADEWQIQFPEYFTTSSFYFHLTNNTALHVNQFIVHGKEKDIPVTVYSADQNLVKSATEMLPGLFQEYENDFGAFAHDSFTAYMHSGGGGMEYSGATVTGLSALDHELFHSWFARSVMPAEGRSGWIDEAMASWHDYGYFQASSLLLRLLTNLSNFSPFRKSTPDNCYRDGRRLLAELDRRLANFGGMKPLMKLWFERYKNRVVTNEEFWQFLSAETQVNLDEYFQRYTLGGAPSSTSAKNPVTALSSVDSIVEIDSKHPRSLTKKEILSLR